MKFNEGGENFEKSVRLMLDVAEHEWTDFRTNATDFHSLCDWEYRSNPYHQTLASHSRKTIKGPCFNDAYDQVKQGLAVPHHCLVHGPPFRLQSSIASTEERLLKEYRILGNPLPHVLPPQPNIRNLRDANAITVPITVHKWIGNKWWVEKAFQPPLIEIDDVPVAELPRK